MHLLCLVRIGWALSVWFTWIERVALQSVDVESESREASYRDIPSIRYTRDNRPVGSGEGTCENGDDEEKKKRTNRVDVVRHDTVDSARLVLSLGSTLVSRLC